MKHRSPRVPIWLASLLGIAVLVAAGCTASKRGLVDQQQALFDAYLEHISEVVDDPVRASELGAGISALQAQLAADTGTLQRMAADLYAANRGYDTTRADLEAGFTAINRHRQRMREKILVARSKAVGLTTPEEWQELRSRERPLMDLLRETPGLL